MSGTPRYNRLMKLIPGLFRKAAPTPPAPPTVDDRVAALNGASVDVIAQMALQPGDETLQRAAQQRLAELIDAGSVDISGLVANSSNQSDVFAVVALCKDASCLPRALAALSDPADVARLVVGGASSRLRQLAAEIIQDGEQIRDLLLQVRGKDNTAYRILKHKRDAQNAQLRQAAEIATEATTVCALLERHSLRAYDAQYSQLFEQLRSRWLAVAAHPDTDMAGRVGLSLDRCGAVIATHQSELAQAAAQRALQQADDAARAQARQAADEAAAVQAGVEAQRSQELAALDAAEAAVRAAQLAAQELRYRQIGGLIRKANGALSEGNTKVAAGLRRAIEEKLPTATATATAPEAETASLPLPSPPMFALPTHLVRGLQQLDDKLRTLKGWKDYAVAPKRIELIEEMELLIGSSDEPTVLADRIRSLQQGWRTISKGIASDASAEWERFHTAAEAAYQPCREYFAAQAKLRADNLQNRKAVLERLLAFAAAQSVEQPDFKLIARVLREAPQEWRQHFPVERAANLPVQGEFDATIGRLQASLNAWYERNVADKQALIERARQLLGHDDGAAAIEAVKQLQIHWKDAGPVVPREQDQSLWNEFRAQCDAIFKKRQQAFAEYSAGLEANKAKAVALCESVEQLATLSGAALLEAANKLSEWRGAFDALDEVPRADVRTLHDRFQRAVKHCELQLAQLRVRDAEQSGADLFEAARRTQAYAWAVASGAEQGEREALKQAAESFIAGVRVWPKGMQPLVQQRLAKADAALSADDAAAEKALRLLCIRAEILNEAATAPEDATIRRDYQMQKLVKGMGKGLPADTRDALVLEWLGAGAVAPTLYADLEARFMRQCHSHAATARPAQRR
jgi:Domain of Unknown Function (DUF349)